MFITNISNTTYEISKDQSENCLRKAIKAWWDEKLTGLTDEEKEKIEERVRAYIKSNPQADAEAINAYVKILLKEFGFKGDINDFAGVFGGVADDTHEDANDDTHKFDKPIMNDVGDHATVLYNLATLWGMATKSKIKNG